MQFYLALSKKKIIPGVKHSGCYVKMKNEKNSIIILILSFFCQRPKQREIEREKQRDSEIYEEKKKKKKNHSINIINNNFFSFFMSVPFLP